MGIGNVELAANFALGEATRGGDGSDSERRGTGKQQIPQYSEEVYMWKNLRRNFCLAKRGGERTFTREKKEGGEGVTGGKKMTAYRIKGGGKGKSFEDRL